MTEKEQQTLFGAAHAVWNEIGYDVLTAVAEEKGKNINAVTVPREEVIEVVCDADRLRDYLERHKLMTPDMRAVVDDYPQLQQKLRKCFECSRYGM